MAEDDVTLGEVARNLATVNVTLGALNRSVQDLTSKSAADFVRYEALEKRIAKIEAWKTWAERLVLGLVLTAVIALVVN